MSKPELKDRTLVVKASVTQDDLDYISERAEKRNETVDQYVVNAALGKTGRRRKKDVDIQRKLVDVTEIYNNLRSTILPDKPSVKTVSVLDDLQKGILELCQL